MTLGRSRTMRESSLRSPRWASFLRGWAVVWAGISWFTFVALATLGQGDPGSLGILHVRENWSVLALISVLQGVYWGVLAWPPWGPVADWLPRILLVLRWQVVTGSTLALTLTALVGRDSNKYNVYALVGIYLLLNALPLMIFQLLSVAVERDRADQDTTRWQSDLNALEIRMERMGRGTALPMSRGTGASPGVERHVARRRWPPSGVGTGLSKLSLSKVGRFPPVAMTQQAPCTTSAIRPSCAKSHGQARAVSAASRHSCRDAAVEMQRRSHERTSYVP